MAGWMPRASSRKLVQDANCVFGQVVQLGGAQSQGKGDQALLGAVVQIALDAPAGLVGGGDDPRA